MLSYHFATTPSLPPLTTSGIEYWVARNGIFARASRPGLEILIPVSSHEQPVRGLIDLYPIVELTPLVPIALLERMLAIACHDCPKEVLFHLVLEQGEWHLITPDQLQSPTQCQPYDTAAGSSTHQALIEIHSHGTLPAYFSPTDDVDECSGFRLYGVMGKLDQAIPELVIRVGLFGHAYTLPANFVFDEPTGARVIQRTGGTAHYAMRGLNNA